MKTEDNPTYSNKKEGEIARLVKNVEGFLLIIFGIFTFSKFIVIFDIIGIFLSITAFFFGLWLVIKND